MIGKLGSHWRWRLPLFAVTLAIGIFAWWLARDRASWSFLPGGAGSTVLLVADKGWCKSIVAWEPSSGKRWTVVSQCHPTFVERGFPNIVIARGGRAVCWEERRQLHIVDVASPHRRQTWNLPDDLDAELVIVGLSEDERFAVFQQAAPPAVPGIFHRHHLSVVDLQTRQVVSERTIDGFMHPSYFTEGEFENYTNYAPATQSNREGPLAARWRLTETGEWKLVEDLTAKPLFPFQYLAIEERADGSLRRLADGEALPPPDKPLELRVVGTSPDFKRATAFRLDKDESLYLLSASADKLTPIPVDLGTNNGITLRDGSGLVGIDRWGDARVLDVITGNETAKLALASQHRPKLVPTIALLLAAILPWVILATRERTLAWALFDTQLPPLLVALALPLAVMVRRLNDPFTVTANDAIFEHGAITVAFGLAGGTAATVAWYWAYGRGSMLVRWLAGLALLGVAVMPIGGFTWEGRSFLGMRLGEWHIHFSLSVVFASAWVLLVSVGRLRGWVISDQPINDDPRRFGIVHFLAMLIGFSVALAMGRILVDRLGTSIDLHVVALCVEGLFLGTALGSLMYLRKRWQRIFWTTIIFATLIATAAWFTWRQNTGPFVFILTAFHIPSWLALAMPLVLSGWIARRHGWHWERKTIAETSSDSRVVPRIAEGHS